MAKSIKSILYFIKATNDFGRRARADMNPDRYRSNNRGQISIKGACRKNVRKQLSQIARSTDPVTGDVTHKNTVI
jgi:hypothetical protein